MRTKQEIIPRQDSSTELPHNRLISSSWGDFYQTPVDKNYKNEKSFLRGDESSYYVLFCLFINQTIKGAIYFGATSETTNFLAEDSLFSGCLSNQEGGSLYFGRKGQCAQNRICSFKSKVTEFYEGVHCYVYVSNTDPFQSKIIESSISHSGDGNGSGTIRCENGAIGIKLTNISHSNTYAHEICFMDSVNSDSLVKFSTFSNNSQTLSVPGSFFRKKSDSNANLSISSCNFLKNRNVDYLILTDLPLYATYCNFESNDMNDGVIYQYSGNATFEKCYFDETPGQTGTVTISNSAKQRIGLRLRHLSTFDCDADFLQNFESTLRIEQDVLKTILIIENFILSLY